MLKSLKYQWETRKGLLTKEIYISAGGSILT